MDENEICDFCRILRGLGGFDIVFDDAEKVISCEAYAGLFFGCGGGT
jgi:hypothetical protein